MTSEKPYWFALAESDAETAPARKEKRNIPFLAVATVGVAVLGGSLFLNTSDEPTASASVSTISSPATTTTHVVASPAQSVQSAPAIAPVAHSKVSNREGEDDGERENNDD
jgi:hypothetical protein